MAKEYVPRTAEEHQQVENDFLKMKLMLETGANVQVSNKYELPLAIENYFLQNVIEFEKRFRTKGKIKVFDKIGRPDYFKPVLQITDQQIDNEWRKLKELLCKQNIELSVCSPRVSAKELYRFVTEELFMEEVDDVDMPGLIYGFIYDEFHPDPEYENTCHAVDYCIRHLLRKEPVDWLYNFFKEGLRLNEHYPLKVAQLKEKINLFKNAYDGLEIREINSTQCTMEEKDSFVHGEYCVDATVGQEKHSLAGNWTVHFKRNEQFGYWSIAGVEIEGIKF